MSRAENVVVLHRSKIREHEVVAAHHHVGLILGKTWPGWQMLAGLFLGHGGP
jgi:hypothetical protein